MRKKERNGLTNLVCKVDLTALVIHGRQYTEEYSKIELTSMATSILDWGKRRPHTNYDRQSMNLWVITTHKTHRWSMNLCFITTHKTT
jgi:hypothetical protein